MKKALFLINLQNWFINKRNSYVIDKIINHLTLFHNQYDVIIYTQQVNKDETQNFIYVDSVFDEKFEIQENIKNYLSKLDDKLLISIEKSTFSVFKGDIWFIENNKIFDNSYYWNDMDLDDILLFLNIKEIHICGLETNYSVLWTLFESLDLWYKSFVIEDCCESIQEENHQKTIDIIKFNNLIL